MQGALVACEDFRMAYRASMNGTSDEYCAHVNAPAAWQKTEENGEID